MRQRLLWMAAALLVLVSMSGRIHGQQREEKTGGTWLTRLWSAKKTSAPKDHDVAKDHDAAKDRDVTTPALPPSTTVSTMVLSERLYRRMEVVNRLHEIAWSTNDEKLRRMAEQLDQRLGESLQSRAPYPLRSDEQVLESRLGAAPHGQAGPHATGRPASGGGTMAGRKEAP